MLGISAPDLKHQTKQDNSIVQFKRIILDSIRTLLIPNGDITLSNEEEGHSKKNFIDPTVESFA